ncbi:MAG: HEAT repeat domain-containing protein [Methanoregula sp.]|nr:MAG: HEAT repeat domain-containing protein [Methanoregula sp.]
MNKTINLPGILTKKKPDIEALAAKKDIAGLVKALQFHDITVQSHAAQALGSLGTPAMDALVRALKKKDKHIRLGIIEALTIIRDPDAVAALTETLKDESSEVRWETAIALGEIGDELATVPLVQALKDHDKYVRFGAAFALAKIGWKPADDTEKAFYFAGMQEWKAVKMMGKSAIPALSHILNDRDSNVRQKVIEILGEIGDPDATPALIRSLADENTEVRWKTILSSPRCRIKLMHLPRGLARRPKMTKNPLVAGFLNFMLPGLGYGYLGKWWGVMIFQIDITATVWLFKFGGETNTYSILFPLYLLLGIHAYYITVKMPEPPI